MNWWIKIEEWIKGLATWAKVLTTVIVAIGTISGGMLVYKNKIIDKYEKDKQEEQRTTDLQEVKGTVDTLVYLFGDLSGKVDNIDNNVGEFSEDIKALQQSWGNWLYTHKDQDPLTEKTFVEFMETRGFDLKKNSTNKDDMIVSDR